MVAGIFSGIAAVAAFVTVYYARATVSEARRAREEATAAHAEEMAKERQLLEATTSGHQQEMAERRHAFERELWLQRLAQLGTVQELLGATVDAALQEIASRGHGGPTNIGIAATRLSSAVVRVEAATVILERLGGPRLGEVLRVTERGRQGSTALGEFVADVSRVLASTRERAVNDEAFEPPGEPCESS